VPVAATESLLTGETFHDAPFPLSCSPRTFLQSSTTLSIAVHSSVPQSTSVRSSPILKQLAPIPSVQASPCLLKQPLLPPRAFLLYAQQGRQSPTRLKMPYLTPATILSHRGRWHLLNFVVHPGVPLTLSLKNSSKRCTKLHRQYHSAFAQKLL
jgi:hypothetical protein